jgi:hypothetical protein
MVVLPRARVPRARVLNVHLARWVHEALEAPRHDRDGILAIINVRDRQPRVHVVCERVVADARHAIADHAHARACGQVKWQVHRIEQRERSTERMSSHSDGGRAVTCE